MQLSEKA